MGVGKSVQDRILRLQRNLQKTLAEFADEVRFYFQAYVEESFEETSQAPYTLSGSDKLHVNSGALTRSYIPGQPGNINQISVIGGRMQLRVGTSLIYAKIHEYGGFIKSKGKMAAWFWYEYYRTTEEFFRNMALHVEKYGGVTIPKRSYHRPAVRRIQTEGKKILVERLRTHVLDTWKRS